MLTVYPIFAEYHYYVKQWLKTTFTLPRIDALGQEIPVVYSTPRRAFALGGSELEAGDAGGEPLYSPPNQGNNWLPIVTFHMATATPILSKTIPAEHVLTRELKDNNDNVVGYKKTKPMLPYEISYTASFYAGLMQDADILLFKFASEFRPQCYLWIGPDNAVNDTDQGLWAHMLLDSVADATEYEPGDIGERVVRKDLTWRITEAYVPLMESAIDEDIIRDVYGDIYNMPGEEIVR
jgi:hypothetical protein